nr:immunoglobulin heavy chain junction region [Macaca mulatta]MOV51868.1 immunoglobulin heavy chain junction region [Macaca mulatta]MOV52106.1 immunoglobulin heavy chain junction region [Macaca mulatta]MOV53163.1 immunoglobulin heavy chain junction region [Macaca mulatta]
CARGRYYGGDFDYW